MKNEITYHKEGDYLIPNITVEKQEKVNLGKYGNMRFKLFKKS